MTNKHYREKTLLVTNLLSCAFCKIPAMTSGVTSAHCGMIDSTSEIKWLEASGGKYLFASLFYLAMSI